MSTEVYYRDGKIYDIGTIGLELSRTGVSGILANFFRVTYPMMPISSLFFTASLIADPSSGVPTYGKWSGPGWGGGKRTSSMDWTEPPCYNENVKTSDHPERCYSLVDAICKTHDWRYY